VDTAKEEREFGRKRRSTNQHIGVIIKRTTKYRGFGWGADWKIVQKEDKSEVPFLPRSGK
jgi:hypothetical protein